MTILIIPSIPNSLKFTAQGYKKITSTSKRTKSIATKKYFTENGMRAFPTDSIPHSKFLSLLLECLFGPKKLDPMMVKTTNPMAKPACISIGKKSDGVDCIALKN